MTIKTLTFNDDQWHQIVATAILKQHLVGTLKEPVEQMCANNVLRLALGFPPQYKGGPQPGGFEKGNKHGKGRRPKPKN